MANLRRLSKFLALILRHKAEEFGLQLDEEGFVALDDVWQQIETRYPGRYSMSDLEKVVTGDKEGKQRYEIVNGRIRAMFGHGAVREIVYPIVSPPDTLFHGSTMPAVPSIKEQGLQSLGRQYVHLTTNPARAEKVAERRKQASVMLWIRSGEMADNGYAFHQPEEEHFLTKVVPPEYIVFPDEDI